MIGRIDMESEMVLKPIGVIHTPFTSRGEAPHKGRVSKEICEIEIFPEFEDGLMDIDKCTHLIVLYWLDRADRTKLRAVPPHDGRVHGVFATRSPDRPNPVAFSVAELLSVEGRKLRVRGLDALNGTPLIDIKPYSAGIDCVPDAKIGWWEEKEIEK